MITITLPSGKHVTVTEATAQRMISRFDRQAEHAQTPAYITRTSVTNMVADLSTAAQAVVTVAAMDAAVVTVATSNAVAKAALSVANVCNNRTVRLAENILATRRVTSLVVVA